MFFEQLQLNKISLKNKLPLSRSKRTKKNYFSLSSELPKKSFKNISTERMKISKFFIPDFLRPSHLRQNGFYPFLGVDVLLVLPPRREVVPPADHQVEII
jgi:hypothetical protein